MYQESFIVKGLFITKGDFKGVDFFLPHKFGTKVVR